MENQERLKRISVAERFRRQNLSRVDLLTGDNSPIPKFHPPLIPLPFEPLTKSQILSLYDKPFAFQWNSNYFEHSN